MKILGRTAILALLVAPVCAAQQIPADFDSWIANVSEQALESLQKPAEPLMQVKAEAVVFHETCGSRWISVYSEEPENNELVCQGFRQGRQFMEALGYHPKKPINLFVVKKFPEKLGVAEADVHGCVDMDTLDIYMTPFRLFSQLSPDKTLMDVGPGKELYISYVAHEVNHPIAAQNYADTSKKLPKVQAEYIAYASQLATMDEALRQEVLKRFRDKNWDPFEGPSDITLDYHDMNPNGFAVKSYLYFQTPEGKKLVHDYINAKINSAN